ncbi:hypothetical protein CANCADRAFT_80678 [Tortispora caseinolytica NRRL Y-17796]|uniref:Extracellular membrane protein CFEM domain-containing protein n=1 Tax=Tortispora caseinolytica NRRL Y-17796 TaxID=767744 RepID=A0A1E4TJU2_9ASCO|nr:hypothetical protein CANCADRAFT_80678 [Tortispora caseinolytica NRRL Y-17796]
MRATSLNLIAVALALASVAIAEPAAGPLVTPPPSVRRIAKRAAMAKAQDNTDNVNWDELASLYMSYFENLETYSFDDYSYTGDFDDIASDFDEGCAWSCYSKVVASSCYANYESIGNDYCGLCQEDGEVPSEIQGCMSESCQNEEVSSFSQDVFNLCEFYSNYVVTASDAANDGDATISTEAATATTATATATAEASSAASASAASTDSGSSGSRSGSSHLAQTPSFTFLSSIGLISLALVAYAL